MTTLQERLREAGDDYTVEWGSGDLYYEAADRIAALEAEADEWRKLLDPHTLHANLVRGLPAQLTLEQRRHLAGNDERIAALEAENAAFRDDAERWRTFLDTRPASEHDEINAAVDTIRSKE